jgi:tetrahydromethanopterin S-methyltransferase subunit B
MGAKDFLSTLKQLDEQLRALASRRNQTLQSLFHSLDPREQDEITSQIQRVRERLGDLSQTFYSIQRLGKPSKTECTTLPSSGGPTE